ncbi:MAG: hypothetical protein JWM19_5315 [Actinomycetia bacterium]|nr:hypothetical protein [Actinomycetes bacterium]
MTASSAVEGALVRGLHLASRSCAGIPGLAVVPWRSVPADRVSPGVLLSALDLLGDVVLKWSVSGPGSFSPRVARGAKPAAIHRLHADREPAELWDRLETAMLSRVPGASALVLQQAVEVASGCLFDAELAAHESVLEFRTPAGRRLHIRRPGIEWDESIGDDERLPGPDAAMAVAGRLQLMRARLPRHVSDWQVEGLLSADDGMARILQLRPTPADRPAVKAEHRARLARAVGVTAFVWGSIDAVVGLTAGRGVCTDGTPVRVAARTRPRPGMEPELLTPLAEGLQALLLNLDSGSRITHEPFSLPPVHLRQQFVSVHCHVPGILEAHGGSIRVVSDGDRAGFLPVTPDARQ